MSSTPASDARRAGWMILGLLAVPVLSVSSAAMLADVAATTDPASAAVGIPATLVGVLMGCVVFRLGRAVGSGVVALRTMLRALAPGSGSSAVAVADARRPSPFVRPAYLLVPAQVGRRGPPVALR
ncbi:MAG: hypothetical protein RIB98_01440 [Acidimicrobiales bacterium]